MPSWTSDLPRFALLDGPSPLRRLERFSGALGGDVDVWIKREDLLPLAFGGNKLRNLEFLVGAALAEGADTLITTGRRWSNHARLTAAAGARAGLDVHLVLSGPATDPDNPGVRLERILGATVHMTATDDRAARTARLETVVAELRAAGRHPYVIGTGGSGVIGATGQVLAALELHEQAAAAGITVDRIVVPTATGGTHAGLLVGSVLAASRGVVAGVLVAGLDGEIRPAIEAMLVGLAPSTGVAVPPEAIELDDSQLGDGYARPTAAAEVATALLARTEGILVDPIYTAKALAAIAAAARAGALAGQTVVFWHAGGLPGLFEPLD